MNFQIKQIVAEEEQQHFKAVFLKNIQNSNRKFLIKIKPILVLLK